MREGMGCLLLVALILIQPICGQRTESALGWDLTYSSILAKNKVERAAWIRKWLMTERRSPAKRWISTWQGEPILSSILIEYPAFHAGERTTMWFIKTKTRTYYWESVQATNPHTTKRELAGHIYDDFFKVVASWPQYKPLRIEDLPKDTLPGFIGIISFYDKRKSRQMLLTFEDFSSLKTNENKLGRLMCALVPVLNEGIPDKLPKCDESQP